MQVVARIDETGEWVRCGNCGQKLFRIGKGQRITAQMEIKCHSCKAINYLRHEDIMLMHRQMWIFTFGSGQKYAGHYVKFYGTYGEAREKMNNEYGTEWGFQYNEDEWKKWVDMANKVGMPVEIELKNI